MTRVNVGIPPRDLCDQHLIAEYHELPRCFATRRDAGLEGFRLGTGHVLWCAQFQWSLYHRQWRICSEMQHRGITVNHWTYPIDAGKAWSTEDETAAVPLLQARIRERLSTMKRTPTWTRAKRPDWIDHA